MVSPFDQRNIPGECFGGTEDVKVWDQTVLHYTLQTRPKINNAYILFYQRSHPQESGDIPRPIDVPLPSTSTEPSKETTDNQIVPSKETADNQILPDLYDYSPGTVPKALLSGIWDENKSLIRKKHIFNPDYFNFIWDLTTIYQANTNNEGKTVIDL